MVPTHIVRAVLAKHSALAHLNQEEVAFFLQTHLHDAQLKPKVLCLLLGQFFSVCLPEGECLEMLTEIRQSTEQRAS